MVTGKWGRGWTIVLALQCLNWRLFSSTVQFSFVSFAQREQRSPSTVSQSAVPPVQSVQCLLCSPLLWLDCFKQSQPSLSSLWSGRCSKLLTGNISHHPTIVIFKLTVLDIHTEPLCLVLRHYDRNFFYNDISPVGVVAGFLFWQNIPDLLHYCQPLPLVLFVSLIKSINVPCPLRPFIQDYQAWLLTVEITKTSRN